MVLQQQQGAKLHRNLVMAMQFGAPSGQCGWILPIGLDDFMADYVSADEEDDDTII